MITNHISGGFFIESEKQLPPVRDWNALINEWEANGLGIKKRCALTLYYTA